MTAPESVFPIGYFFIISKLNGFVVDVENPTEAVAGARILLTSRKQHSPERDSQLWIHQNGFLTNKMTGLVLDINRSPNFMAIFNGEQHLYLDQMKEEEAAHDQRFGFEQETGFIYSLHDSDVVFNIRKAQVTENGRVIVHKRTQVTEEGEEPLHQHWTIELGDPLKVDSDDDEEDDRKRARLRSWFGNWSGWNKRHNGLLKEKDLKEAHEKVYKQKKASLSHELLAAAAAFEAVSAWEKKQEANGEPMRHSLGKKLIASLAAAELVKLYEERGVGEEEGKNEDQKQQSRSMMQKMSASAAENLFDAKHKDD